MTEVSFVYCGLSSVNFNLKVVSEIVTEFSVTNNFRRSRISAVMFLQFHECFMFLQFSAVIRVVRQLLCPIYGYIVSIHGKNTIDRFQCHALKN